MKTFISIFFALIAFSKEEDLVTSILNKKELLKLTHQISDFSAPEKLGISPLSANCNNTPIGLESFESSAKTILNLSSLTKQEALDIFNEIKNLEDIPFHYPDEGCFARAHAMASFLE